MTKHLKLIGAAMLVLGGGGCNDASNSSALVDTVQTSAEVTNRLWTDINDNQKANTNLRKLSLNEYNFSLNLEDSAQMTKALAQKPKDTLPLPLPDGSYIEVAVKDDPLTSPDYQGEALAVWNLSSDDERLLDGALIKDPQLGYYFTLLMTDGSSVHIDPKQEEDARYYISMSSKHMDNHPVNCGVKHDESTQSLEFAKRFVSNTVHTGKRLYRFAPVATFNFHRKFGWDPNRQALNPAITWNFINRLLVQTRLVTRKDLSVEFALAGQPNTNIITSPANDFTAAHTALNSNTQNASNLILGGNATYLNAQIGSQAYDIGHIFDYGGRWNGGGFAYRGEVCTGLKAGGYSSFDSTTNNANNFSISLLAHEVGHQLGASHTYSSASS